MHMVQLMPLHPKTPSSLASFKSRLVLPFWYRLTEVVLEKRPLKGGSSIYLQDAHVWHMSRKEETVLTGTYTFIYKWDEEPACLFFLATELHSQYSVFISHPAESINQSINVKFVGRRYTRRPGAPTVVSGTHDQKVHSSVVF